MSDTDDPTDDLRIARIQAAAKLIEAYWMTPERVPPPEENAVLWSAGDLLVREFGALADPVAEG